MYISIDVCLSFNNITCFEYILMKFSGIVDEIMVTLKPQATSHVRHATVTDCVNSQAIKATTKLQ